MTPPRNFSSDDVNLLHEMRADVRTLLGIVEKNEARLRKVEEGQAVIITRIDGMRERQNNQEEISDKQEDRMDKIEKRAGFDITKMIAATGIIGTFLGWAVNKFPHLFSGSGVSK